MKREKGPDHFKMIHVRAAAKVRGRKRALLRLSDFMSVPWGCKPGRDWQGVSRTPALEAIGIESHSVERADFGCR